MGSEIGERGYEDTRGRPEEQRVSSQQSNPVMRDKTGEGERRETTGHPEEERVVSRENMAGGGRNRGEDTRVARRIEGWKAETKTEEGRGGERTTGQRRIRGPEPGEIAGRGARICEGSPGVMKGRPPPRSFSPGTEAPLLTTPISDQ